MRKHLALLLFAVGLTSNSCIDFKNKKVDNELSAEDFRPIEVNGEYQISIPRFMKKTTGLNEEASLQFQNLSQEAYIIIIDESKDDFIETFRDMGEYNDNLSAVENYRDVQLQLLENTIHFDDITGRKSHEIGGLNAESVQIDVQIDGIEEEISYFLTFVEGTEKVYMMMAWTLKSKKEEHKKTFETITDSFELIKP